MNNKVKIVIIVVVGLLIALLLMYSVIKKTDNEDAGNDKTQDTQASETSHIGIRYTETEGNTDIDSYESENNPDNKEIESDGSTDEGESNDSEKETDAQLSKDVDEPGLETEILEGIRKMGEGLYYEQSSEFLRMGEAKNSGVGIKNYSGWYYQEKAKLEKSAKEPEKYIYIGKEKFGLLRTNWETLKILCGIEYTGVFEDAEGCVTFTKNEVIRSPQTKKIIGVYPSLDDAEQARSDYYAGKELLTDAYPMDYNLIVCNHKRVNYASFEVDENGVLWVPLCQLLDARGIEYCYGDDDTMFVTDYFGESYGIRIGNSNSSDEWTFTDVLLDGGEENPESYKTAKYINNSLYCDARILDRIYGMQFYVHDHVCSVITDEMDIPDVFYACVDGEYVMVDFSTREGDIYNG